MNQTARRQASGGRKRPTSSGPSAEKPVEGPDIGRKRKPSKKQPPSLRFAVLLLVGGLLLVIIMIAVGHGCIAGRVAGVAQDVRFVVNDDELNGMTVVDEREFWIDATDPYYSDSVKVSGRPYEVKRGDIILFTATGRMIWDRRLQGTPYEVVTPNGVSWEPASLPAAKRPSQFKAKHAALASLIGVVGDGLEYDKEGRPHVVKGTRHFAIGSLSRFAMPKDGTLYLAINERWIRPAWHDNAGQWTVTVKVWRRV